MDRSRGTGMCIVYCVVSTQYVYMYVSRGRHTSNGGCRSESAVEI